MSDYAIGVGEVEGHPVVVLRDGAAALEAAFAPTVGMVGCSLRHRDEELLGQRKGLDAYARAGSTMGIPLLHPWANRLAAFRFDLLGREVVLAPGKAGLRTEEHGLPIHGLLAAAPDWTVTDEGAGDGGARLVAELDFAADPARIAAFPFPHALRLAVGLREGALTLELALTATGDVPVPVAFGFHPYLRLPGLARADWEVTLPVSRRLVLDERQLPTGAVEPTPKADGPLGDRTFDDGYEAPPPGEPFVLAGGGRRIALAFDHGYPFAQVFAPAEDDVVAFEPMTAPTNALLTGGPALRTVAPGDPPFTAAFTVRVA